MRTTRPHAVLVAENGREWQTLSARQRRALTALLSEPNIRAAAKLSRTAERTLFRYLADPMFRERYREHSQQLLQDATGRLRAAAGEAVHTLRAALKARSEAVRVRAALGILDMALKVDSDELAARVAALEAAAGAMRT